jgi:uncharacterized protein YndB with AHSA1/START domain
MTKESSFKRRVRERMTKTGESYATARTQVAQKRDRVQAAHSRLATTADRPSDEKVVEMTGRRWEAWFSILDRWGARQRKHGETVAYLMQEHNVPSWWAQSVTMWFERDRGLRLKHQQADGFTIYVSKTFPVPLDAAFDAFVNARTRRQWLTDGSMTLRTSQPGKTARFNWDDGATRVNASFEDKGPGKVTVAIAHERLPDPDEAESAKALWRKRLAELKSFLSQGS